MVAYNFLENVGRLEFSCFYFFLEPAEADVIVGTDKLPAQDGAGMADVELQLTRAPSSDDHSLHLLTAGLSKVGHVVLLWYIATKADLYGKNYGPICELCSLKLTTLHARKNYIEKLVHVHTCVARYNVHISFRILVYIKQRINLWSEPWDEAGASWCCYKLDHDNTCITHIVCAVRVWFTSGSTISLW